MAIKQTDLQLLKGIVQPQLLEDRAGSASQNVLPTSLANKLGGGQGLLDGFRQIIANFGGQNGQGVLAQARNQLLSFQGSFRQGIGDINQRLEELRNQVQTNRDPSPLEKSRGSVIQTNTSNPVEKGVLSIANTITRASNAAQDVGIFSAVSNLQQQTGTLLNALA